MQIFIMLAIPKLIMQTWKSSDLPDKWQPTQIAIGKYMNEWQYILMTDDMNRTFVQHHFPTFLPYYDAFPYNIQRADAIRYCWLYINGGLYFDCDFELLDNLDHLFADLTQDLFLLTSSNTPSVITNGFMASKPKNSLWLNMIEEMKKPPGLYSIERHLLVMNTTGPLALNRVIQRTHPRYQLLPRQKLSPYTICEKDYNKPNTLAKPLEGSSWVGDAAVVYQWCYCHTNYLLTVGITLLLIIILGCMFLYGRDIMQ